MGIIRSIRSKFIVKVTLSLSLILALIAGMVLTAILTSRNVNQDAATISARDLPFENDATQAYLGFLNMDDQSNMWVGLKSFGNHSLNQATYQQIIQGEQQLNASLAKLQKLATTPRLQKLMKQTLSDAADYEGYFQQVRTDYKTNYKLAEETMYVSNSNASNNLTNDLTELVAYGQNMTVKRAANTSDMAKADEIQFPLYGLILFVACLLLSFYVRRSIRPVPDVAKRLEAMASGNLQIEDMSVRTSDEIGRLATAFNQMKQNLRQLVGKTRDNSNAVAHAASALQAGAEETTKAVQSVAEALQNITHQMEEQNRGFRETMLATEEMSSGVQVTAEAASEVTSKVQSLADSASSGNDVMQETANMMNSIATAAALSQNQIQSLADRSTQIEEIIRTITEIAKKTNLLALNAAIEAARAGETGRGFAVVANEVRNLATEATKSAEGISELIRGIQLDVAESVEKISTMTSSVAHGSDMMRQSATLFSHVETTSSEIAAAIEGISAATEEMSANAEEISAAVQRMAASTDESALHVENVSAATEEQMASMEEVAASATELHSLAASLQESLTQFQV
ncbi:MAG: HAMP domain-containing methyl-accepting chemotaxis protein [Alicyclobacillaceae bacterium]|jgi:methyl-accepting chemotaxis protein|nr:HAMP domain-containing methyl-accepting chemotaxis protein [Alicyclobacillaceae bacterium]